MDRPWMQFYTRDWLDCKELARCSPISRAVLVGLMCLAHEGKPYGFLSDSSGPLSTPYMASRCFVTVGQMSKSIHELTEHTRLTRSESGGLFVPRMVEDEAERIRRTEAGRKGGNPNLVKQVVNHPLEPTRQPTSDSDSVSVFDSGSVSLEKSAERNQNGNRFAEWLKPWPRCANVDQACRMWISVIDSAETEAAAFAARDRYLASDEVSRGAIMETAKWLQAQKSANWEGRWPVPPARKGSLETLSPYFQKIAKELGSR